MKPTIVEGDRIFVNKLAYDLKVPYTTWHIAEWGAPQRGEIVVFFSPADGRRLVKRVVGLPGDVVAMENDRLIINGQMIDYQPMAAPQRRSMAAYVDTDQFGCVENLGGTLHPLMISPLRPAIRSFGPVTVPEGKYFMMGGQPGQQCGFALLRVCGSRAGGGPGHGHRRLPGHSQWVSAPVEAVLLPSSLIRIKIPPPDNLPLSSGRAVGAPLVGALASWAKMSK